MRTWNSIVASVLLSWAATSFAQAGEAPEVRQARERTESRRREATALRQGERVRRDQAVPGTSPLDRIQGRIANRLGTRLGTRLGRTSNDGRDRIGASRESLDDRSRTR